MVGSDDNDDGRAETIALGEPAPSAAASVVMPATIGRYQLVARLGAGAMGVVWSARDPQLERQVAIKVVHPRLASAPEASHRMLREARAMAKLSHRAVVTVYDAGEVNDQLFLAMELIDCETLTARLRRPDLAPPTAWRARLALVLEAGRGLAAAHAAGVLHRDFKPDNVLVAQTGRVCVGDFGLATLGELVREQVGPLPHDLTLTTTGALLGTPVYMSPQLLRGQPADARADQFAFCVTAYEALYRVRPFAVDHAQGLAALPALIAEIEAGALVPPAEPSLVPAAVGEVLRRGLAADPAARWPELAALLAALDDASGLRARRRRRAAIIAASVAAIAVAAGAGALAYARNTPPGRVELRPLFRVPPEAALALGPGGRTIGVGFDHLEIHEPGAELWTLPIPPDQVRVYSLHLDEDSVRYVTMRGGTPQTWRFREAGTVAPRTGSPRRWLARFAAGDLYVDGSIPKTLALVYARDGRDEVRWPLSYDDTRLASVSPDAERVAWLEHGEREDTFVIGRADGALRRIPATHNVTALAWLDATTLIYARNTQVRPSISTLAVGDIDDDPTVAEPHEIYHQATGWFMRMIARDHRVVVIDGNPISRVRVFGDPRDASSVSRDYAPAKIAAHLGWLPDGDMLVWNRTSHFVARAHGDQPRVDTGVVLGSEPVNATIAGDVLIATVRSEESRDVEAYDLRTGARLWRATGTLLAVRCTDDQAPPCVAVRTGDHAGEVVEIDPQTGVLGATRAGMPGISDVALHRTGSLLIALTTPELRELDAHGALVRSLDTHLATLRSVAYDAAGGIVIAGTVSDTVYTVGRVSDGAYHPLATAETELLLLARPSPDGSRVAVVGRTFSTELADLVIPE